MVQIPGPPLGRSLEHIAQHIGDKAGGAVIKRARYQLRDELRDINQYALNLQKAYGNIKDQELQLKLPHLGSV